jgi:LytR cell envelope-related transcriptional attenuator
VLDPTAEAALPTAPAPVSPAPDAGATAPFVPGSTADGSTGEGAPPASAPAAVPEQPPVVAAPAPGATGGGGSGAQAPAGGGQPAVRAPLRVYNNSLVPGLAARAAENFKSAGWTIDEVGGFQGRLLESAAYYRPGTDEEAAAKALADQFDLVAKPRFAEIQGARPGVIVILIRDYAERGKS